MLGKWKIVSIQIPRKKFKHGGSFIECSKQQESYNKPQKQCWEVFSVCISSSTELWKIESQPDWISKMKPFMQISDWRRIAFPSDSKDWSTIERNYNTVALNILYISGKKEHIRKAYISKHCLKLEYKAIMIILNKDQDCTKRNYIKTVLIKGMTTTNGTDFTS